MKKIIALFMLAAMAIGLVACAPGADAQTRSTSGIAFAQSGVALEPLSAVTPGKVAQVYNGSTLMAECDSFADAVELCETYSYTFVRLVDDVDARNLEVNTLILDLNGHKLENLTVAGTLYGLDSTTDRYDGTNAGTLTGVTGTVQPVWKAGADQIGAIRRYLTVEKNGSYSFHRFYVGITNMSLTPSSVGAGYTAVFAGDAAVKAQLADTEAFGFSVWVEDYQPVSMSKGAQDFSAGANSASLHVKGIMKTENSPQTNLSHAAMQVNGKAFITFKNSGKVDSADYAYVLENMVEKVDREYDSFNADQKAALQDMYDRFPSEMDKWTVPNMFHKNPADSWQVWDGTSVNGKFYLAQDMTLTSTVQIPTGSKLELDLNGRTLTGDVQLFDICGELTVRDSYRNEPQSKQGVAKGASTSPAPVFNLQQTGSFRLYSGNLTTTSQVVGSGGIGVINGGHMEMTGGQIYGGSATELAGGIYVQSGSFNMSGGKVYDCTASDDGQDVYASKDATVDMGSNAQIEDFYQAADEVIASQQTLSYDDRKDIVSLLKLSGTPASVRITDEVVTSKQVGSDTADAHVLAYENGTLYAVGTGTAILEVDGVYHKVTVKPAKISLFMITGTSIGQGDYGEADKSVAIEAGQAYSTYLGINQNSTPATDHFTGAIDVTGGLGYGAAKRAGATLDAFAPGMGGNAGEGSGLAYQWNKLTGEKVWVMNVARGASSLNRWKAGGDHHQNAIAVFTNAQTVVQAEIAAGHFTMGDMAIIYHNGLNFSSTNELAPGTYTEADLKDWYDGMLASYRQSFNKDLDGDGVAEKIKLTFSNGVASNWTATMTYKHEHDKAMAFYLSVTDPDMAMASDAICGWEKNLDHFPAITYTSQSGSVTSPDSMKHINNGGTSENSIYCWHDNCHLSQVGYNGLGIDTANNLYGFLRGNRTINTVSIHDVERNEVNDTTVRIAKGKTWKFAPIILPVYGSGLTFETSGAVAQVAETPWLIEGVEAGTGKLTVKQGNNILAEVNFKVTDGHVHCVCENADATEANHTCNEDTLWQPIGLDATNPYEMTHNGHYFLDWEGNKAKGLKVADGATAYLCLNGATIRAQSLLTLGTNSHLVVCDCSAAQTGCLQTTKFTPVTVAAGQSVTLYSGTITGYYATGASRISVKVTGGSFTMFGGKVADGCKDPANVTDSNRIDVNPDGANIQAASGIVAIYGGCVTGGVTEGLGKDIYIGENASITLGGTVTIGELYLASGKQLTLSNLSASSSIGINTADKGVFVTGLTSDTLAKAFTSTAEGYEVSYASGNLSLVAQASNHKHCWCVNAEYVPADHKCEASTAWTPLTSDTVLEDGGHYYLTEDHLGAITAPDGEVYICLGGKKLTSSIQVFKLASGKTVHLCSCNENGSVLSKYNGPGPAVYNNGGTFHLWSGKLTANPVGAYNGGVVAAINGATFHMYGGEIYGGTITGTGNQIMGGNVNVGKDATFAMYGGEIHDGSSGKYGGNVAMTQSTAVFEMQGGRIYDGNAGTHGGNVGGVGTFRMEGGQIYGGTATTYGGNLSLAVGAAATITGGSITGGSITGGTATEHAPCVNYNSSGAFTVGGSAQISDVYLNSGKTLTVSTEKPLTGNKSIGLTLASGAAGTAVTGAASADAFRSNMNGFKAVLEGNKVVLAEGEEPSIPMTLKYDDRKDISKLLGFAPTQVEITDQAVTSKQVGTNTADAAVLKYENGTLYAVGTGTATLRAAGCTYNVTVEKAKLSMFMITGHSIAAGGRGDAAQSVVVEAGQAYSTCLAQKGNDAPLDPDASAATIKGGIGYGSAVRPDTIDQFAPGQGGNVGEGSGLAYQWNKLTGEKVWVINVAKGGSCLNHWAPNSQNEDRLHDLALAVFNNVQAVAKAEFAAGHYELGNMALIYHNAANFGEYAGYTQESMQKDYADLWASFQENFNEDLDGDGKVDTISLGIVPMYGSTDNLSYDKAAAYYLCATEENIFTASDFTRQFVLKANAANNYNLSQFPAITYTAQSKPVAVPESLYHINNGGTSENSFYCKEENTHYQQVVYNAMGFDLAQQLLNYLQNGRTVTSAQIVNEKCVAMTKLTMKVGETKTFAITCDPIYGGELTVETSGVISQLDTPWIIRADAVGTGKLTVKQGNTTVAELTVTVTD